MSYEDDDNQDGQNVRNHQEGDKEKDYKNEESSRAYEEKKGDGVDTAKLGNYEQVVASPPLTIKGEMLAMLLDCRSVRWWSRN